MKVKFAKADKGRTKVRRKLSTVSPQVMEGGISEDARIKTEWQQASNRILNEKYGSFEEVQEAVLDQVLNSISLPMSKAEESRMREELRMMLQSRPDYVAELTALVQSKAQ